MVGGKLLQIKIFNQLYATQNSGHNMKIKIIFWFLQGFILIFPAMF